VAHLNRRTSEENAAPRFDLADPTPFQAVHDSAARALAKGVPTVRLGSYASGTDSRVGLVHRDTLIEVQHAYQLALVDQSLSESEAAGLAALACPP
jgi:hypothetical protein